MFVLFDVWITSMRSVFYVAEVLRFLVLVLTYPKLRTDLIGQPKEKFLMFFWMNCTKRRLSYELSLRSIIR